MIGAGRAGTRRELIARGLGLARHGGDVGALRALVRAEQVLVATYEQLLGEGILSQSGGVLASELLAHERAHLTALTAQLKRLGGTAPRRPAALEHGFGVTTGAPAADERSALRTMVALERATLSVYYAELGKLRDPGAAQVATEIMACEAQHTTALRAVLYPGDISRAVPSPFVFGNL